MSNNVVSQEFQFADRQMVQMDNLSERVGSLTSDIQKQVTGHISHSFVPFHMPISNDQGGTMELMTNYSGFPNLMVSKNQIGQMETNPEMLGFGESGFVLPEPGPQTSLLPSKRKPEMEATTNNSVPQQQSMVNKRAVQMGTSSHLSQSLPPTALNRKSVQMQSRLGPSITQNMPLLNKKLVRNESISGKSGSQRVQTPKSRTVQVGPTSKVRIESVGAVRSKMREKLAEALSLASENQDKSKNAENNHTETSSSHKGPGDTCPPGSDEEKCQSPKEALPSETCPADRPDNSQLLSAEPSINGSLGNHADGCKELHHGTILPQEDVSFGDNFFAKDELLQGNGLSWALDFDMGVTGVKEIPGIQKPKVASEEACGVAAEQRRSSPENLALQIETELFKLFGGVNKKYKEKGRSLCFNLKDPNNPELRERVMSGEISPERLCSMTAEELASKELSEWRMAKAEELAQMIVLPDTDFDRRRLVKKTHKGEYQVEMEEDSGDIMDVSNGTSLLPQNQPKSKEMEANPSSELAGMKDKENFERQKNGSENPDLPDSLIIPSDGTDLMQGMMVDELKDAEFLPPIISLDEFMESLNSEPPFENLQVVAAQSSPTPEKENSDVGNSSAAESEAAKDLGDAPSDKADEAVTKQKEDVAVKSSESSVVQRIVPPGNSPRIEHLWEGTLQLTISSAITTFGVFKSGEKTTTLEWPSSLEIKGRVRLDAFEKFIKELPMSRSRAVMILHFALKDGESEGDRANLLEAVDSYISDERLGFAEPTTGVELYFCPPNGRMIDMLSSYLMKDREDIANSSDNVLIGVVVWRKAHISSTISPTSSSHNKHSSMKRQQHVTSRRQHEKDANVNVNLMTKGPVYRPPNAQPPPDDDDDDYDSDIPPGFGPPGARAARDDDDLPEFNFSGNINSTMVRPRSENLSRVASFKGPLRPVDQMRKLVQKYGQTGSSASNRSWSDNKGSSVGLGIEPWNDDDDDDIPEWRPQAPQQQPQSHLPNHGLRRPLHETYGNQKFVSTVAQQQLNPAGIVYQSPVAGSAPAWQQGGTWVQPSQGSPGNQPSGGQYYRMPLLEAGQRQDISSRGF